MAVRRRNRTNQNIRSIPSLAHQAMNSTIAKTIVAASAAGLATALAHRYCSCREKVRDHGPRDCFLSDAEALGRSALVSNTSYSLRLKLTKGSATYDGECTATFDINEQELKSALAEQAPKSKLFLDFAGHVIGKLKMNGHDVTGQSAAESWWHGEKLYIPLSLLLVGQNIVEVVYTNEYNHGGDGFHQFIDPADKLEYLYTNFEPYFAHRLLPCFDQPDIKARLTLHVVAPSEWKVFGNNTGATTAAGVKVNGTSLTAHSFAATDPIAPYLFAVVAGPYESKLDSFDGGRIPLGVHCRRSLMQYLDYDEIFEITKQGFAFYEAFFDRAYPFQKYDQIFCAEFNVGAMENVGLVTFNEAYIFRDPPTLSRRAKRADTILHEMSHMWFGNLVTCAWWDGLWLNESFATYTAALAVAQCTKFGEISWLNFNSVMKQWAMREDQLSTTHAVHSRVTDTDNALANFDGLTYGKGASLLKQLVFVVGMDGFKTGMRYYFKKFAWGNTQIGDFLGALEHGAASVGRSFDPVAWSASFLETAGLNSVSADLKLSADGHKIQSLTLVQAASSDHPTIREHLLELGVYDLVGTQAKLRVKHEVRLSATDARVEVAALAGQPAPAFLFANHDDHAYLKIELDSKSRAFALKNIGALQEPLTRQLGWQSLWNACRDAQLSAIDYLALAREQVACETDPQVLGFILTTASGASANYIPNRLVAAENDKMFDALLPRLQAATNDNKPLQVTLADQLIAFASTSRAVSQLVSFLQPNAAIGTYVLGQAQRWRVVVRAAAHALDVEGALLKAECLRDRTDTGLRAASTARWAVPDAQVKKAAWSRWHSKEAYEKMSTYELLAEMSGFGHGFPHQAELMAPYIEPFFAEVREVYRDRSKGYHDAFFDHLFPFNPESDQVQALSAKLLASLDDSLDAMLKRSLKEQIDALDRARACRKVVGF